MQKTWYPEDQRLLEIIKGDIMLGPTSVILEPPQRVYISTYWYKYVMGAVLLKEVDSVEEIK